MIDLFPDPEPPKPSLLRVDKSTYQFPTSVSEIQILDIEGHLLWQKQTEKAAGPVRWQGVDAEGRVLETGDYVCKLIYPDGKSVQIPFVLSK